MFRFLDFFSTPFDSRVVSVCVDETPITRRYGGIGTRAASNTVWVIGAVDIVNPKGVLKFLTSRGHRNSIPFLDAWIIRDIIIHTDYLSSYRIFSSFGYSHRTVNHCKTLVSQDGIHTNHIEGVFGSAKRLMRDYKFRYTNPKT